MASASSGDRFSFERLATSTIQMLSGSLLKENAARIVWATGLVPLVGSWIWYYSRTVIEVSELEQVFWLQMWVQQECPKSIESMRRLVLGSGAIAARNLLSRQRNRGRPMTLKEEVPEEKDGGRFAPPKLFFTAPEGLSTWAWCGWWPVSIACGKKKPPTNPWGEDDGHKSYFLTIWLAPDGIQVAKKLLLRGRELYLESRAKRTEIWIAQILNYGFGGNKNTFSTVSRPSRPMETVIIEGNTKQLIKEDAIRFLNSERWYVEKGIPYRRGYLLYGPPGCGKTSLVTALAGDLRLPIVLVNLGDKDMTDSNLVKFLSEIPRDSIVLLEDIDCAVRMNNRKNKESESEESDAKDEAKVGQDVPATLLEAGKLSNNVEVMARLMGKKGARGKGGGGDAASMMAANEGVTLSGLLNAIDGVGAQEGRLLFMTTNQMDDLDEALIRPGRVDARFHVGKASKEGAGQLFDQFFQTKSIPSESEATSTSGGDEREMEDKSSELEAARASFLEKVVHQAHSFAELQGVLMKARNDPTTVGALMDEFLASL